MKPNTDQDADRAAFEKAAKLGYDMSVDDFGNFRSRSTRRFFQGWQAAKADSRAMQFENDCKKEIPLHPSVGDGLIWDGGKWLNVAPSCETLAMINMLNRERAMQDENVRLRKIMALAANLEMVHPNSQLANALREYYNPEAAPFRKTGV